MKNLIDVQGNILINTGSDKDKDMFQVEAWRLKICIK